MLNPKKNLSPIMGESNFYMANTPKYHFLVDDTIQVEGIKKLMQCVKCTRAKIMYQLFFRGETLFINNHKIKLINSKTDYKLYSSRYVNRSNARYDKEKAKNKYIEEKLKFIEKLKSIKKNGNSL